MILLIYTGGFMAKSKKRIEAKALRKKGKSIKQVAKILGVSKSSASLWCRDVELTQNQIEKLHRNMVRGSYAGRIKGAHMQKERKEEKIEYYLKSGLRDINKLNDRELFITGLGLYWGEGNKKTGGVRFCNSDPSIIKFIMKWFTQALQINTQRFSLYININRIHKKREKEVKTFWINLTGLPTEQFRKVIFIKSKNKKVYENFNNHYGTLDMRVLKSTYLLYQIRGWLKALESSRAA